MGSPTRASGDLRLFFGFPQQSKAVLDFSVTSNMNCAPPPAHITPLHLVENFKIPSGDSDTPHKKDAQCTLTELCLSPGPAQHRVIAAEA